MPMDDYSKFNTLLNVSRETFNKVLIYQNLLNKWQKSINLVAPSTLGDALHRHFIDSLQLLPHLPNKNAVIIDLGSGAGFPGMAIALCGYTHVHLVESDARKCAFLQEVARETGTTVSIHNQRIENFSGISGDVVVSRALASLSELFSHAEKKLHEKSFCLFHKGENYFKEMEEAKRSWKFDCQVIPSITAPSGVILHCSHLTRVSIHDTGSR